MPLTHGYGVVIGTVGSHFIDPPDAEGRWPHYHINVNTPVGGYECVINLKSRTEIKLEYRDFRNIARAHFASILALPNGFHPLASNATSGALDVLRHPGLQDPYCGPTPLWWPARSRLPGWWPLRRRCPCTAWWPENGTDIIELMQYYLLNVSRIYIFGEPYTTGIGMHNVHMNQGDPIDSPFAAENAIWQDGGTLLEYGGTKPHLSAFLTKFQTQSFRTDNLGRPI